MAEEYTLQTMNDAWLNNKTKRAAVKTDRLNPQVVQAVELTNAEVAAQAPAQISVPPDMMITQAAGLIAEMTASYAAGSATLAAALKTVAMRQAAEALALFEFDLAYKEMQAALAADVLATTALTPAAAAGVLNIEAVKNSFDIAEKGKDSIKHLFE